MNNNQTTGIELDLMSLSINGIKIVEPNQKIKARFDMSVDTIQLPDDMYKQMVAQFKQQDKFQGFESKNSTQLKDLGTNRYCNETLRACMTNNQRRCDTFQDSGNSLLEVTFDNQKKVMMK